VLRCAEGALPAVKAKVQMTSGGQGMVWSLLRECAATTVCERCTCARSQKACAQKGAVSMDLLWWSRMCVRVMEHGVG